MRILLGVSFECFTWSLASCLNWSNDVLWNNKRKRRSLLFCQSCVVFVPENSCCCSKHDFVTMRKGWYYGRMLVIVFQQKKIFPNINGWSFLVVCKTMAFVAKFRYSSANSPTIRVLRSIHTLQQVDYVVNKNAPAHNLLVSTRLTFAACPLLSGLLSLDIIDWKLPITLDSTERVREKKWEEW